MRIGSLRDVPTDILTDLNHPVGRWIADALRKAAPAVFGITAAAIAVAFLIAVFLPNVIMLFREFHIAH